MGQVRQVDCPVRRLYVLTAHSVHSSEELADQLPAGHSTATVGVAHANPAGHGFDAPVLGGQYIPEEQGTITSPPRQ